MKYSDNFALTALNGYSYSFNLNSTFDPNRTGVGHQPYGRDSLAAIYNRYRVISCSYTLNCYSGVNPIRFATIPTNDLFAPISLSEVCENPRSRFAIQFPGGATRTIHGKVYLPSLEGRTTAQYMADDSYQALATASPSALALLNIYGGNIDGTAVDVNCTITLNYTVEWFDYHTLAQS